MHVTNAGNGIRTILQQKKARIQQQYKNADEVVVLIKPTEQASYSDLINAPDEMEINVIKRYVLMDVNDGEMEMVH